MQVSNMFAKKKRKKKVFLIKFSSIFNESNGNALRLPHNIYNSKGKGKT